MNKKFLVSISALILVFIGTWTYIKAEGEQISMCVKKNGLVYIIGNEFKRQDCKENDSLISWNTTGPQGPKGDKGDQGLSGTPSWDESRIVALEARVTALENPLPPSNPCLLVSTPGLIVDNFNSYANGSILGQGGWANYVNGSNFIIQDVVMCEGLKALHNTSQVDSIITKSGNSLADGRQTVYIKTENRVNWASNIDGNAQVRVSKGPWASGAPHLPFIAVSFKNNGNVAYYDSVNNLYQNFATYNDNQWTLLEMEWRSSDKTARYRVNNGTWTSWYTFQDANSFVDFDNVGFDFISGGTGGVYIDTLH